MHDPNAMAIVKIIQIVLDTAPFVAKHNNKMKIKSKSTNTTVTKNNNFVGKTFNFTKLNNKYIVAAIITIEKITPNTLPILLCFLFFFHNKNLLYVKYNTTNIKSSQVLVYIAPSP